MKRTARRVGIVIGREYLQRVRKKSFIFSTIAIPVIMIVSIALPVFLESRGGGGNRELYLVDPSGRLAEAVAASLTNGGMNVVVLEPGSEELEGALARASEGDAEGVLELDSLAVETGRARWSAENAPSPLRRFALQQAVTRAAARARLEAASGGEVPAELLGGEGEIDFVDLSEEGPSEVQRVAGIAGGMVGGFLLYFTLLVYGTMVMRAVLEEKTGRIAEVVLSSMHPRELMFGKIIGVGAVGFTQLAIWVGTAALLATSGLPALLALLPEGATADVEVLELIRSVIPAAGVAGFFLICFVLGFLMYASLFAAVGSMCASDEEAQQMQAPIVMLVIIPMLLLMPIVQNPEATYATTVSLIPFFSPVLMFARVASGAAPLWQAALSIVLMAGTLVLVSVAAGKIYRTGVLMQGKRPTLPEIWRWVRAK